MDNVGVYIAASVVVLVLSVLININMRILNEVRRTNGRLIRLEEWKDGHTTHSDYQHAEHKQDLARQEKRIDKIEGVK